MHPVFHVFLLKPVGDGTRLTVKPAPVFPDNNAEFEVEAILDSKRIRRKLHYMIHWKGYGPGDRTWEPAGHVHAPRLLRLFHRRYPDKAKPVEAFLRECTVKCAPLQSVLTLYCSPEDYRY